MRGSRALVTRPKLLLLMSPVGLLNCAWLKMLKNSPRISKCIDSLRGISLVIPRSVLLIPGPWKKRRLAVPKDPQSVPIKTPVDDRPQAVAVKALESKYVWLAVVRGLRM